MKKTSLEKLIFKNYINTSLVSIVCIEVILIFIYFFTNNKIIDKTSSFILNELNYKAMNIIRDKKEHLSQKFLQIESAVKLLQENQQNFFSSDDYLYFGKIDFDEAPNGMYYKTTKNNGSAVVVSSRTEITDNLTKELVHTEIFDIGLKPVVEFNDDIVAAYYASNNNYIRYYPFIENIYKIYPSDLNLKNYSSYLLVGEKINPEKKVKWTEVYLDPAKKGWIISAVAPIYKNNKFEGYTGVDIKLDKFIDSFLNLHLPHDGRSFLMRVKLLECKQVLKSYLAKKS